MIAIAINKLFAFIIYFKLDIKNGNFYKKKIILE